MEFKEIIEGRRSVRAYLKKEIPKEVMQKVIQLSQRAPSWKNVQAYKLHIVSGKTKDQIREKLIENVLNRVPDNPDYPFPAYSPPYTKKRMLNLGKDFYNWLKIDRKDKDARNEQMLQNFKFFDAPSVIFIFMEKGLEFWPTLDLGILVSHIMLSARSEGLETIAQASLAAYPDIIKKELQIENNWNLALGISIGYGDMDSHINKFYSDREPLEEITIFHD